MYNRVFDENSNSNKIERCKIGNSVSIQKIIEQKDYATSTT